MSRLPVLSAGDVIRILQKEGFSILRQRGSHIVLQKKTATETVTTVVPNHKELAQGTLRSIVKRAGISIETLLHLAVLLSGTTPRLW